MSILGIDEAGRGCVLGPLVIGSFFVEQECDGLLIEAGATDSKKLSHKRRLIAREALSPLGVALVKEVSAREIDAGNLNDLEERVIVELIAHFRPDKVIVDALGHPSSLPQIVARLDAQVKAFGCDVEWLMEPKADLNYPVVGAASIFAKTSRDAAIEAHKSAHGDFGSGYPSDPKTRAWLVEVLKSEKELPAFIRTRWGTIKALRQQSLF